MMVGMGNELERFVASLAIPADRKAVVLAELSDHVASATEAAARAGMGPEDAAAAGRAVLGDLEALRRSIEAVEPAFRVTWRRAVLHGLAASIGVVLALEIVGSTLLGALTAIAAVAVCAPPRALALLRAELRATRVRGSLGLGGVPVGAMAIYAVVVMAVPVLYGIVVMISRAARGLPVPDPPPSSFAVIAAVIALLVVESVRARRSTAT
jgi:hypothetical protein